MTDLTTRYLGFELSSPLVASAGPLTSRLETLEMLREAGAAAVVLPSLFEEEVIASGLELHDLHTQGTESFAEALTYLPDLGGPTVVDRALELVEGAKGALDVPVIASVNGTTPGGWVRHSRELVDAGADALELNLYSVAADVTDTADMVEERQLELVRAVREAVSVPLAVKLSPYYTALGHFAVSVLDAGADGLVLFNRFYQPDINLDVLDVQPTLHLSSSPELRLPLRWIAILAGQVDGFLAASTGVHRVDDVVKALLAGADVAMSTSALLVHGAMHLATLRTGLEDWLAEHEYHSVAELRGSVSRRSVPDPDLYERAQYARVLHRSTDAFLG
jgi:dihydroorotate dehydrogenase (fumarate)